MKIKIKNGSYIYDINRPKPRHGQNTLLINVPKHDDAYMC